MAHNIGEMFYVGNRPWHKLGTELKQPATMEEAIKAGGLDWTVSKIALQTVEPGSSRDQTVTPSPVSTRVAVVRSDREPGHPGRVVGVVHPGFIPLQNRKGLMMLDKLLGGGNLYHTGGYLGKGEVIWVLARISDTMKIAADDLVEPYLLFTNSHDGSIAVDMRFTAIRVVCQNTLTMALERGRRKRIFKRSHDGSLSMLEQDAEEFLKEWLNLSHLYTMKFQLLDAQKYDEDAFVTFLGKLLPEPAMPTSALENRSVMKGYETRLSNIQEARQRITRIWKYGYPNQAGLRIPPSKPTLWGALNAVTAYVDHDQPIKGDRYEHLLFGPGNDLKEKAYRMLADKAVNTIG